MRMQRARLKYFMPVSKNSCVDSVNRCLLPIKNRMMNCRKTTHTPSPKRVVSEISQGLAVLIFFLMIYYNINDMP